MRLCRRSAAAVLLVLLVALSAAGLGSARSHHERPASLRAKRLAAQAALLELEAEADLRDPLTTSSTSSVVPPTWPSSESTSSPSPTPTSSPGPGSASEASDESGGGAADEESDSGSDDEASSSAGPDDDGGTNVVLANSNSIDNFDDGSKQKMLQEQSKKRIKREQQTKQATYDYIKAGREGDQKAAQKQLQEMKQKTEEDLKYKEKQHQTELEEQATKAKAALDEQNEKAQQKLQESEAKEKARVAAEQASKAEDAAKAAAKKQEETEKAAEADSKQKAEQEAKAEAAAKAKAAEEAKKQEEREKSTPIPLGDGVSNYDSEYAGAGYSVWDNMVFTSGLVRTWEGLIGTMPAGHRPNGGRLIFTTIRGGTNCRMDVLEDGRIYYVAGGESQGWISLSGIWYDIDVRQGLALVWNWQSYGYGYRQVSQDRQADLCIVSGLIRSGWVGYYGYVRDDCRPTGRLIFSANNHDTITRMDLLTNGYFVFSGGYANYGWVSFDGIAWSPQDGNVLDLLNGWSNYGGGYRTASYMRTGRVCSLTGLIRSDSWNYHIATLPEGCRPRGRLVFAGNVHMRAARLDVTPDGHILYISHRMQWDWISLDQIKFIATR